MSLKISKKVTAHITRRQWARLWGQKHMIEPVLIEGHLGDGMKLVAITPINTRPNYYLIRVDSTWSVYNRDTPSICEHIDEIYDAIEDEVGPADQTDDDNNEIHVGWPAMDGSGCSWCDAMDLLDDN